MPNNELARRIENSIEGKQAHFKAVLPELLFAMEGRTDELVREHPRVMADILSRTGEMDVASFVTENPDAADRFQAFLWSGLGVLVVENPEVANRISEDITTNFVADDCLVEGHLEVDPESGTITGGPNKVDGADITITGPADVLVGLVTGDVDPISGLMTQRYTVDGSIQKATTLAPIMNSLSDRIPE